MDKISCIAYLLFQKDDAKIKNIAIQLLNGDIFLKDIMKMSNFKQFIAAAEAQLKEGIDMHDVTVFVGEYLLVEV